MIETITPPRPTFNDDMLKELAERIGKEVYEWCTDDTTLEDAISGVRDLLRTNSDENGYELAKELERAYFCLPDAELVDILDSVHSEKQSLIFEATKKWVQENNIEPELAEGTPVVVPYGFKTKEGIIDGFYWLSAQYKVIIPSEGMTKENSKRALINYEDAKPITQPSK